MGVRPFGSCPDETAGGFREAAEAGFEAEGFAGADWARTAIGDVTDRSGGPGGAHALHRHPPAEGCGARAFAARPAHSALTRLCIWSNS